MSLLSVDPWPLCPECERRVRLDFIADGGIVRWRHVDGTAGCPEGAARAWRGVVGLLVRLVGLRSGSPAPTPNLVGPDQGCACRLTCPVAAAVLGGRAMIT